MSQAPDTIGIIGAGKVGVVLAGLAADAGHRVLVAGSGAPEAIALQVSVLVPTAHAVTAAEAAREADVAVLALPLSRVHELRPEDFADTVVVDATNYWPATDGQREDLGGQDVDSSRLVQDHLASARVVKAFNHMGYHDLAASPRPAGDPLRRAIALAGDDEDAVARVAGLIDRWGFDPLPLGPLERGRDLQPGHDTFGATMTRADLARVVGARVRA